MKNCYKEYDIIFLGLAQNCEKFLPNIFDKIDKIAVSKKVKVLIGENNSNDYTFEAIQEKVKTNDCYELL